MENHEIRFLQGWSLQEGSSGDTFATAAGGLCSFALLQEFNGLWKWGDLSYNIHFLYGAGATKWISSWVSQITFLSPDREEPCQTHGHLMDYTYGPYGKKIQWSTTDFSGILKVFKDHYSLRNLPKYCQLMAMSYSHATFKDTDCRLSFITQNIIFFYRMEDVPGSEEM